MENNSRSLEDIKAIRKIMEESSRFLSLSGLSGVLAGMTAIAGALVAYFLILENGSIHYEDYLKYLPEQQSLAIRWQLMATASAVLVISVMSALWLSVRKAKRDGKSIITPVSGRMVINLMIPLAAGGVFTFVLMLQNNIHLIVPSLLIFYGLALVNAGKFTFGEIFYLGLLEIITGLAAAFVPGWGLLFWIFGFGILHIIYGMAMHRKYGA